MDHQRDRELRSACGEHAGSSQACEAFFLVPVSTSLLPTRFASFFVRVFPGEFSQYQSFQFWPSLRNPHHRHRRKTDEGDFLLSHGSGTIGYDEFLKMMTQKILNRDPKDEILKAFRLFDDDETVKNLFQ